MQKKLAVWAAYISLGLSAIYSAVASIVAYSTFNKVVDTVRTYDSYYSAPATTTSSTTMPMLIGGILVTFVAAGLIALYFYQSKRVKATLVK